MKRLKALLLMCLPIASLILSGCNLTRGGNKKKKSSSTDTSTTVPYIPPEGDPDDPGTADNHITKISMKYTKDFFMQVGDELDFSVTFTGGGPESEKGIQWESSNPNVLKVETQVKTSQCVLTALREGSSTLVARSTFNRSLTDDVTITVIDNSDYTYFWEMNKTGETKSDNKLFNGDDGKTKTDGTVQLGYGNRKLEWEYHFDTPTKNVGGGQSLTFGSSSAPYGNVDLVTKNSRKIRSVSVLCSSSGSHIDDGSQYGTSTDYGSSYISITIGNTKYIDNIHTPKYSTDQPLDTVTGGIFNDGSLTGDIHIHFSPTIKNVAEPDVQGGAIYLKAIIIEYFRGDLTKIEVDSESTHETDFFVGSSFSSDGIVINAFYSESPETKVVVNIYSTIETGNRDSKGKFVAEAASQDVNITYSFKRSDSETQTKTTKYSIVVHKRLVKVDISGTITKNTYLVNEPIDYTGLTVGLIADGSEEPVKTYNLGDYATPAFGNVFDTTEMLVTATKAYQQSGFRIGVKHKNAEVRGYYSFAANDLVVKVVQGIEIQYKDGTEEYNATLVANQVINYDDFNVFVKYDNEEQEEFTWAQMKANKYVDPKTKKDVKTFDWSSTTPLVALEEFETNGFTISVRSKLANVTGTLEIKPEQVVVESIANLEIVGELEKTAYDEFDDMSYTGLSLKITYDTDRVETITYQEAQAAVGYVSELDKEGYKTVKQPLFSFDSPTEAIEDMEQEGFNVTIKHEFSDLSSTLAIPAHTLNVSEYIAKTYTRVDSFEEFDATGNYIIASINPDNSSFVRVWNGALDKDHVWDTPAKGGNYVTYQHDGVIGKSLVINKSKVEKSAFYIVKNESTVTVMLMATKDAAKPLKLTINSGDASFVATTSSNAAKQQLLTIFDPNITGNVQLGYNGGTYQKFIYYNKSANSDRFGSFNTGTNTLPIQIYKVTSPSA